MSGLFITFEGIDGCGKTTQSKLLFEKLVSNGHKVHLTREPGGSLKIDTIRALLKSNSWHPVTEMLLMFAARKEHLVDVILPKLEENYIVISDRFYDSTIVYQGVLKEVDIEMIMNIKHLIIGNFEPDLTFFIDISAEESICRFKKLVIQDAYDALGIEKRQILIDAYHKLAKIYSDRVHVIKSLRNENLTFEKINGIVEGVLQKVDEKN